MSEKREVWITGIGVVSSLGIGIDPTWEALRRGEINVDRKLYSPWMIHPIAPFDLDAQIPKRGDQRQMEIWQRIGTYAAGLALDTAGLKGDRDLLAKTDMIVAAGGGERDLSVDESVLLALLRSDAHPGTLNELLIGGLRPTLFLAQLSNLLAGNISIVHGVSGSSRTFMGEEGAGMEAVRTAWTKIAHGQSDVALVGAAQNAQRLDLLMLYECGGYNLKEEFSPVWRRDRGGFALGSGAAFLVLESRDHAESRGAVPYAILSGVASTQSDRRAPGAIAEALRKMWENASTDGTVTAVFSGATGAANPTSDERDFLRSLPEVAVRGIGTSFGHLMEAQFPLGIALAAVSLARGELYPPPVESELERLTAAAPSSIAITAVGHWRGEAIARLDRVFPSRQA
jgi:3-oxoacyl-[acyl-carrier-protein] synthase II